MICQIRMTECEKPINTKSNSLFPQPDIAIRCLTGFQNYQAKLSYRMPKLKTHKQRISPRPIRCFIIPPPPQESDEECLRCYRSEAAKRLTPERQGPGVILYCLTYHKSFIISTMAPPPNSWESPWQQYLRWESQKATSSDALSYRCLEI